MNTAQLLIVAVVVLAALAVVALTAIEIAKDATSAKLALARQQLDAAAPAGELAAAITALEASTERAARGPSLVGATLVVHTRKPDDQSVRGVVAAHYADRVVLRDAQYLHPTGAQDAGGLVDVLLINVSTWQELQAPGELEEPS